MEVIVNIVAHLLNQTRHKVGLGWLMLTFGDLDLGGAPLPGSGDHALDGNSLQLLDQARTKSKRALRVQIIPDGLDCLIVLAKPVFNFEPGNSRLFIFGRGGRPIGVAAPTQGQTTTLSLTWTQYRPSSE